ncbi:MAG: hypothetical protein ACE5OZ_05385 [Candidatus Heimdallarchaeota archaeon]
MSPLCNQCTEYFVGQRCPNCGTVPAKTILEGLPSYMRKRKPADEEIRESEERKRLLDVMAQKRGRFTAKSLYQTIEVSVPTTRRLIRDMMKEGHLKCVKPRIDDSPALYCLTETGYDALRYWTGEFWGKQKE